MRILALAAVGFAPAALADDVRPLTTCGAFGKALEIVEEFDELDADRRDVVDIELRPRFRLAPGESLPDRMFLRVDDTERDVPLSADGQAPELFPSAMALGGDVELCVTDSHLAGQPKDAKGRDFQVGMLPQFKTRGGTHSLTELEEGAKDGRKFFKKMAPGAVSFMVPKLDHFAVSHPDDDVAALPKVVAFRGDERLGYVLMEPFDVSQLLSLETLEAMGADRIVVEGDYRLFPMPNAKTVRRFMGGGGG